MQNFIKTTQFHCFNAKPQLNSGLFETGPKFIQNRSQIDLNLVQSWLITFTNFRKSGLSLMFSRKPDIEREVWEIQVLLWPFHTVLQTSHESCAGSEQLFRELFCFRAILKKLKDLLQTYKFSSLRLVPFLVELLELCSAFCTIKIKAFEVSEFAYFIFFWRLCHSLLCK